MNVPSEHFTHSSARENVLEHLFIGDLLRTLWCAGIHDAEILRSEVDDNGYDLVVECKGALRYIQLKSSFVGAKKSRLEINVKIETKPGGCVVWIIFDRSNLELGPFRFLGNLPGEAAPTLGDKVGRQTRPNSKGEKSARPNMRVVNKGRFESIPSMKELVRRLFGDIILPSEASA